MAILAVAALLIFAASSFFFAVAESSLFSLGKWQLRQMGERSPRSQTVAALLAQPHDLLATIVLGNIFANAIMVGSVLWIAIHVQWPMLATVAALLVVVLFGAEMVPKTLAVRSPELWALRVAPPMSLLLRLTKPFRQIAQRGINLVLRSAVPHSFKPQPAISEEEY